ncbi:hypothetical protein [Micromonospora sp. NPDC049301]|uniref:hypothetical protein n=1 Tax=Micromonospora sp. NPDC049301 TaxID=3155723 RepID=UPI003420C7A5
MAKKMLGKVVAGAALGGASLLVFTPGIAFADGHHDNGKDRDGKVHAKPHVVKAGDEVKLLEICPDRQEHAFVWSKVTGKVKLKPVHQDRGDDRGEWSEEDSSGHDDKGKDEHGRDDKGKDEHGKDHNGKDEHGKDDKGKDEHGKDDKGKDEHGKDHNGKDEHGKDDKGKDDEGKDENGKDHNGKDENGGYGGGAAADDKRDDNGKDWKGDEHGQDAEDSRDKKDWESKDEDKKDRESKDEDKKDRDSKDEDKKDWESKDEDKKDRDSKDEDKKDRDSKNHDEYGSDERGDHGKDGRDEDRWEHKRDFVYYGEAKVDKDARPGRYELKGSCGEGELVVHPRGGVDGGDGGASTGTDRGLATGGASLLGAAALGGIVLMRRRRTDGSLV